MFVLYFLMLVFFDSKTGRQKILHPTTADIALSQYALRCFERENFMCQFYFQIFEIWHNFKEFFFAYLNAVNVSYVLWH